MGVRGNRWNDDDFPGKPLYFPSHISTTMPIQPRGPAANHLPSIHPSNPYNFPEGLWYAGKLPPKVTDKYVFFFGYEGEDPHVCLQQWFPSPFKAPKAQSGQGNEEVMFPTTEHYMMYQKAVLMGDTEVADRILSETHPSAAKRLGREVKNFDAELWKRHADRVVEDANYYKFSQNEDMKEVLLTTGGRILVEARYVGLWRWPQVVC